MKTLWKGFDQNSHMRVIQAAVRSSTQVIATLIHRLPNVSSDFMAKRTEAATPPRVLRRCMIMIPTK